MDLGLYLILRQTFVHAIPDLRVWASSVIMKTKKLLFQMECGQDRSVEMKLSFMTVSLATVSQVSIVLLSRALILQQSILMLSAMPV